MLIEQKDVWTRQSVSVTPLQKPLISLPTNLTCPYDDDRNRYHPPIPDLALVHRRHPSIHPRGFVRALAQALVFVRPRGLALVLERQAEIALTLNQKDLVLTVQYALLDAVIVVGVDVVGVVVVVSGGNCCGQ